MALIQPVIPAHPKLPRDCCGAGELLLPVFGACSPALRAVFTQPPHSSLPGPWNSRAAAVPSMARSCSRSCSVSSHAQAAPLSPVAAGVGFSGAGGRHRAVWPCRRACPRVSPLGARRMLCPCAGCAVAMEIACAVARQLKHPRPHTAMPRNAQLSSFPSPFCDLADMTPLALIPLHSVALLRFLGVNPESPKKPARHCK